MKFHSIILFFILSALVSSCSDNLLNIGANIRPASDAIIIDTDVISITSQDTLMDYLIPSAKADSILLGKFYNSTFGTTLCEILTQVEPNEIVVNNSIADSTTLTLVYKCNGDAKSQLNLKVYKMNLGTFDYTKTYLSNIKSETYCDKSELLGEKLIYNLSKDSLRSTRIKLSKTFTDSLFAHRFEFNDREKFLNFFKGLYLTTTSYGLSTMLTIPKIDGINLQLHTHLVNSGKKDTTIFPIDFPANDQVKKVNLISHPDRSSTYKANKDVNYISSPANIYTKITLPLKTIKHKLDSALSNKKQIINTALLKLEIEELAKVSFPLAYPKNLLLIKADSLNTFFSGVNSTSETSAIVSTYNSTYNSYSFNLAKLIEYELSVAKKAGKVPADKLELIIVPVQTSTSSSSIIQSNSLSGVAIKSAQHATSPMRIKMIFSGF